MALFTLAPNSTSQKPNIKHILSFIPKNLPGLYGMTVAPQNSSFIYSTYPSENWIFVIASLWVEQLGSNKTRLYQPKTKSMWRCLPSFPEQKGGRILHTNHLSNSDQWN